jgi:hypothetical protein
VVPTTILIPFTNQAIQDWLTQSAAWAAAGVQQVIVTGAGADKLNAPSDRTAWKFHPAEKPFQGRVWNELLDGVSTPVLLLVNGDASVILNPDGIARLTSLLLETGASAMYSNYAEETPTGTADHPTIPYQLGSIRDGFDFGPVVAISTDAIRQTRGRFGPLMDTTFAAWYDLRLRLSVLSLPVHIPETLYRCRKLDNRPTVQQIFDYQDPRHRAAQEEMEKVATEHLKRIGAYLAPGFSRPPANQGKFPVEASVVIPVRNRARTIADAVRSALTQEAPFKFNVIVVDNHSTDGTTDILRELAAKHDHLVHLIPERTDLGIGGCWNHAVQSPHCGRVAVQLDSDDLYSGPDTLRKIVAKMDEGYAMVVGSYQMVNFELKEIPPGLIDHREWTRDNGRNNLLRVNGLGAPRAFLTELFRRHPLPNVSYGEDYWIGMRLSREYEIGRIFESIYLCRRWDGNTDANLPLPAKNAHDTYKDRLRTLEILARQQMNLKGGSV